MKVAVTGGRSFFARSFVYEVLDELRVTLPITFLIEGGATGADRFAQEWAVERGIPYLTFEANWKAAGNAAGHWRNRRMLLVGRPERVIAFPGGTGTADMKRQARENHIEVIDLKERYDLKRATIEATA